MVGKEIEAGKGIDPRTKLSTREGGMRLVIDLDELLNRRFQRLDLLSYRVIGCQWLRSHHVGTSKMRRSSVGACPPDQYAPRVERCRLVAEVSAMAPSQIQDPVLA